MLYFDKANALAHGASTLVHIAAAVTDPTALSTLSGAANGWFALKEALNLETDGLKSLYRDTERQLQARLKTPDFHMGKTDRTALPQMLIDVRPDLAGLVAGDLNADIILSRMIKSLGDQPYERKEAFENWVKPVLEGLLNNKDLHAELTPQINRALLSRLSGIEKNTQEIKADTHELKADNQKIFGILRQHHGLEGVVDNKDTLSKDQLEAICLRFDPDFEETESVDAMRDFLKAKSKQLRAYRAAIDQMPDGAAQLHNLKAAAKDALDALDFEQVERLLSRVDEVETEISVATKVLRAKNALLRNRAEAAFDILDAAAAAQGSIDPLAPAKARLDYADLLYNHGLTFGGSGLFYAVKMIERALADLDKSKDAALWATAQNNLGIALRTLGERQGGEEGIARMNDAITAYQNALQVVTKDSAEMDWAMTQNNLGIALSTLGERQSGEDAIARLKEAVTAYQKALEVYTKDNASINWAKAQVNMALVYNVRAAVFGGEKAKADLEQALFHVDAALGVFDPVHSPYNHDTATTLRERILSALNAQKG